MMGTVERFGFLSPMPYNPIKDLEGRELVGIPSRVEKYKIRARPDEWATIFLKFPDRIEHRFLDQVGKDKMRPWKYAIATNIRGNIK